jgi:hypothetical protein
MKAKELRKKIEEHCDILLAFSKPISKKDFIRMEMEHQRNIISVWFNRDCGAYGAYLNSRERKMLKDIVEKL